MTSEKTDTGYADPRAELKGEDKAFLRMKFIVIACLMVFIALLGFGIARYYSPIPGEDDWEGSLAFFANVSAGDWRAWFAQFAEHRPVLPRVLYWADIRFFDGRFLFELIAGLLFAIGAWATLLSVARATIADRNMRFMVCATVTLLLTSWMQIANFTVGFNAAHWFMSVFFVLATLVAVALSKTNQFAFCAALICGIAAAGTMANGIVALPLAVVLALLIGLRSIRIATLVVVTGVVLVAYFSDYVRPPEAASPLSALVHPLGIAHYTLTYLGSIAFYVVFIPMAGVASVVNLILHGGSSTLDKLSRHATDAATDFHVQPTLFDSVIHGHPIALAAGFVVAQVFALGLIIILAVLGWRWLRSDRDPLRGALIIFVVFVCGSALGTSLGRFSAFGLEQSISPRYTTPTLFACAALVILMARYMSLRQANVLFLTAALLLLPRQLTALRSRTAEHARQEKAMQTIIENRDTEADRRVLGDPAIVERVAKRLRAMENPPLKLQR